MRAVWNSLLVYRLVRLRPNHRSLLAIRVTESLKSTASFFTLSASAADAVHSTHVKSSL